MLFAFVLNYIPSKEILGLLGLIPIFLGLKVLLLGDSDGEAIAKDGLRKDNKNLIFLVAMITLQVVALTILVSLSHILPP